MSDPRARWRPVAWFFGAYAVYLSVRTLPSNVKNLLARRATRA